jgi:LacI family transcriptional regulator
MPKAPRPAIRRPVTITDIARACGVSKSTVSLVLQGSPRIRPQTQQRVRQAAAALGYVYNRRAAALRAGASNAVGVLINDLLNPFFMELLVGIEQRLVAAGYVTIMAHTAERLDLQEQLLATMREHGVAGLILSPALATGRALIARVKGWGIPTVIVTRSVPGGHTDFVGADNPAGTRAATAHLLALGHRRIAFVGGHADAIVHKQRKAGYALALREAGVRPARALVVECQPTRAGGQDAVGRLLALQPQPTAAVCYNDIVALGLMAGAAQHGMTIGRDLSVIGFDGIADAAQAYPPLATMDINPRQQGERAATVLLERLQHAGAPTVVALTRPRLLVRPSIGPGPAAHAATTAALRRRRRGAA